MLNLVLCDDEITYINSIEKILNTILEGEEYKISSFQDATELIEYVSKKSVDMVLLDIDMPNMSGIQAAEKLLEMNSDMIIIFITNRSELVFEALKTRPFRFVRKNLLDEELPEAIKSARNKIYNETIIIDFMGEKNIHKFMVKNILYLESMGHYLRIILKEEEVQVRKKISDYEERLSKYGFIRTHNSFLINVRGVVSINKIGITMDNGDVLPIRKGKIEEIKNKYLSGIRRFIDG